MSQGQFAGFRPGARGQVSLFDAFRCRPAAASAKKAPVLEEWPVSEKLAAEKELLGMYVSGHPLQPFGSAARGTPSIRLPNWGLENRAMARIGGLVSRNPGRGQQEVREESTPPSLSRISRAVFRSC